MLLWLQILNEKYEETMNFSHCAGAECSGFFYTIRNYSGGVTFLTNAEGPFLIEMLMPRNVYSFLSSPFKHNDYK